MSDPLADRLSRFTPEIGGFDRDTLLFAAGRASARPARRWQLVAAALAVSQVCTLALLLQPRRERPAAAPGISPAVSPTYSPEEPAAKAGLRGRMIDPERDDSESILSDPIPPEPPLRAFATSATEAVN